MANVSEQIARLIGMLHIQLAEKDAAIAELEAKVRELEAKTGGTQ